MPTVRDLAKKGTANHPTNIEVLNGRAYDRIRKKRKTFEIHLTSALFPQGKITPSAIKKVVAQKVPASGAYNAVFHFGRKREDELTGKLEKVWHEMPNSKGGWYIVFTNADRAATEERVRKLVPKGLVKSSVIDDALAAQS